jgi:hypothetical protein
MAGIAGTAIVAVMFVVFDVAGYAGHIHFILKRIIRMAVDTGQLRVLALEQELGISRLIKAGVVPIARVVTSLTLVATSTVMRIILSVTSEAGGRRILIGRILVATQAGGFLMLPE